MVAPQFAINTIYDTTSDIKGALKNRRLSCCWFGGLLVYTGYNYWLLNRENKVFEKVTTQPPNKDSVLRMCELFTTSGAVIMRSIVSKILPKDTPKLALESQVWVSFVSLTFDIGSAIVIGVLNVISWQVWPRYNGTGLYLQTVCSRRWRGSQSIRDVIRSQLLSTWLHTLWLVNILRH